MRSVACVAVLLVTWLTSLNAQSSLPLASGQRVRITVPTLGLDAREAIFLRQWQDTLDFRFEDVRTDALGRTLTAPDGSVLLDSATITVPVSSLAGMDAYAGRGMRSRAGTGALFGGLAGLGVGIALWVSWDAKSDDTPESVAAPFVLGTTAVGAGVGALIGWAAKTEVDTWREVPLDNLRVSIVPQREGIGIGASLRF